MNFDLFSIGMIVMFIGLAGAKHMDTFSTEGNFSDSGTDKQKLIFRIFVGIAILGGSSALAARIFGLE